MPSQTVFPYLSALPLPLDESNGSMVAGVEYPTGIDNLVQVCLQQREAQVLIKVLNVSTARCSV